MSETTPGETPVERRLREMVDERRSWAEASTATVKPRHEADVATLDAGREALALLRELHEPDLDEWLHKRRQLLARCEGDR